MSEIPLKTKLAWQCRRGMLELDVILIPFLDQHFDQLNEVEQLAFSQLLEQADPDIYTWLMGYGECPHASLKAIIERIRVKMKVTS